MPAATAEMPCNRLHRRRSLHQHRGTTSAEGNDVDMVRRQATIMNADVAGYSRMMARDEIGTVTLWIECLNLVSNIIREFGGRVLDSVGDNVSAEFSDEEAAVRCALKVQRSLRALNRNMGVSEGVRLRIGLHMGELIETAGLLFGDVVNTAARLQGSAEPEEIVMSGALADRLGSRWASSLTDLGAHQFKNLARPIHTLSLRAY
jgi:adenylate cyclase